MMDTVANDHEPLIVTRAQGKPVVMLSIAAYEAMKSPIPRMTSENSSIIELLRAMTEVDELTFVSGVSDLPEAVDAE